MLQFNSTLSLKLSLKLFPYWRLSSLLSTSVVNPETSNASKPNDTTLIQDNENVSTSDKALQNEKRPEKELSKFPPSVKHFQNSSNSIRNIQKQIDNAKSMEELIGIMQSPDITFNNLKNILHLISSKFANAQTKLPSVDGKGSLTKVNIKKAKILPLATPSLIQVLKKLTLTNSRNVPLLRTFAHNITMYSEQLNIKMCGDILYSLSVLNYYDENLLNKVIHDLIQEIPNNTNAPVMGSIVTSIRLLRFKNHEVLDTISKWVVQNYKELREQDFIAAIQCFAAFGYEPENMSELQNLIHLSTKEVEDNHLWLDFVWSLTIWGQALPSHFLTVLDPVFVTKILKMTEPKYIVNIVKLLNINGAAQVLQKDYSGPFLKTSSDILSINIERRKQKQELFELLNETLSEVAPLCFRTNVPTEMGFLIDAECCINSDNEFIRLENAAKDGTNTRIAFMIHDYHDYSRGKEDITGIVNFYNRILTAKNYKVLNLSYHNFSINDKLVKRVKFINEQIKCLQAM